MTIAIDHQFYDPKVRQYGVVTGHDATNDTYRIHLEDSYHGENWVERSFFNEVEWLHKLTDVHIDAGFDSADFGHLMSAAEKEAARAQLRHICHQAELSLREELHRMRRRVRQSLGANP